jgi:microcystin-dependent protein
MVTRVHRWLGGLDADVTSTLQVHATENMICVGAAGVPAANLHVIGNTHISTSASMGTDLAVAGHASVGASGVTAATRTLTIVGASDGTGSSILVGYNSSLASKFSVRDDGYTAIAGGLAVTGDTSTTGTFLPTGAFSAGDSAVVGYSGGDGLQLSGQGTTWDVVLKDDNGTDVIGITTGTGNLRMNDSRRLKFGTNDDMSIYHTGSYGYLTNSTGTMHVGADALNLTNQAVNATYISMVNGAAVTLRHNNSAKLATTSTGATITGRVSDTGTTANVLVPAGMIMPSGNLSTVILGGWLLCDGTAISRTDYSDLFTNVGTTFGTGNGSTTFNIPDFRDRFPLGKGTNNSTLGTQTGSVSASSALVTGTGTTGTGTTGGGTTGGSTSGSTGGSTVASNTGTGTTGTGTSGTGTSGSTGGSTVASNTGTGTTGGGTTGTGTSGTGTTGGSTTGGSTTGGSTSGSTSVSAHSVTTTTVAASAKDSSTTTVLTAVAAHAAHTHAIPGLSIPGLSVPGLSVPGLSVPGLSVPGLSIPALAIPSLTVNGHTHTVPGLSIPGLSVPALTIPSLTVNGHTHAIPGLSIPGLSVPGLSVPALGLTVPSVVVQFLIRI